MLHALAYLGRLDIADAVLLDAPEGDEIIGHFCASGP
jgi:hypothetical protein